MKKQTKVRNWEAVNAFLRRAPKFKHKGSPKQGNQNWRKQMEEN